jgi:copper oxidase (laccase) domain-containing protein
MTSVCFSHALNEGHLALRTYGHLPCVTYPIFARYPELSALTTLRNGEWPAPTTGPNLLKVAGPWMSQVLGIPSQDLIAGKQVHGTNVFSFSKDDLPPPPVSEPRIIPSTDGFLTNARRIALIVVTADCLPIFLYDPKRSVIGLLHCGRAGTSDDIVGVGIERMSNDFGSVPRDCLVVIGPSVGPCCYDVDLWAANEFRLTELGVGSVFNCRVCTKCNADVFYSYRAERQSAGRMISAIALK